MLTAYVGIATRHGLEAFLPEGEHAVRFLARRCRREVRRRAVCYWAVLPAEAAEEVRRQLELDGPYAALVLLERTATDLGLILPHRIPDLVDPSPFPDRTPSR